MPRSWPPKSHRFPVVFKPGDNTTGILKSYTPELTDNVKEMLSQNSNFFHTDHCFNFDVSYYFPNHVVASKEDRVDKIVIMLNGLNEIHNSHLAHYDRIGTDLARKGLGAVLYPTPFHLNRTPYLTEKSRDKYLSREGNRQHWPRSHGTNDMKRHPAKSLDKHPEAMFYCFDQTASELIELIKQIKQEATHEPSENKAFFGHHISRDVEISLLGYSMGGLQALYTFLSYPSLFKRCILINSGVSIEKLKTKPVGISETDWNQLVEKLTNSFDNVSSKLNNPDLLKDVLFGFNRDVNAFEEQASEVLFISGGADEVANNRHLTQLPGEEGLNVIQLHGLQHPLKSPVFDRWFPVISDAILSFISNPHLQILSAEEVLEELSKFKIKNDRWDKTTRNIKCPQKSHHIDAEGNLKMEEIYGQITKNAHKFVCYLMISKRYFANDSELIRAIERRAVELEEDFKS